MEEGEGPVRSSALELEIFVLWAQGPNKDPSLACVLGRGQDVAKLPSPWPGLPHSASTLHSVVRWVFQAQNPLPAEAWRVGNHAFGTRPT